MKTKQNENANRMDLIWLLKTSTTSKTYITTSDTPNIETL